MGALWTLLCLCAAFCGVFFGWIHKSPVVQGVVLGTIKSAVGLKPKPQDAFHGRDAVNLLILGCDEDLSPGGRHILMKQARSDMMLLAHIDFKAKEVTGLSIPRDTLCQVPGYPSQKINAYHAIGEREGDEKAKELSKQAVESLLGVPVDSVIVLDFDAFQHLVDMVGGVDVYVEKNLHYTDRAGNLYIDIKKGDRHLNGYNAMCFVRYRHGDDDFHRQARQQRFLLALKGRMLKKMFSGPELANVAIKVLGGDLSTNQIVALALFAKEVDNKKIRMGVIPVDTADNYNLALNESKLPGVLRDFGFVPGA